MSKKYKVEYKRVDEKTDNYRRILVKFNPHFWGGCDFEIEFVPLFDGLELGEAFIKNIDSMASFDLFKWISRHKCIMGEMENYEFGTIPKLDQNMRDAKLIMDARKEGWGHFEPRSVIGGVKQVYDALVEAYSPSIAFAYNCFLLKGQLPSIPVKNEFFTIEKLKSWIEDFEFMGFTAKGEGVKRPLVQHLIDSHKTEYIQINMCRFINVMYQGALRKHEEIKKKRRQEGGNP